MIRSNSSATRILSLSVVLLAAASIALSGCLFGGDDEPQVTPQPPPASDDAQPQQQQPAAEQPEQPDEPQQVSTTDDAQQQAEQAEEPEAEAPVPTNEYVVVAGDTLANIAFAHGVRLDDLIRINSIQNPNLLRVGQVLLIPSDEPEDAGSESPDDEQAEAAEESTDEEEEEIETPSVTLPNTALGLATTTTTSTGQFPQPGPDATTDNIPNPPTNFIQYGAGLLPWLHGRTTVGEILPLFNAWPMPPLAVGNNRMWLVDTNGDGAFSVAIVFTDPSSFGAAMPFSNLVVFDPVPGRTDRYRIGYDHRLAYGRAVQGLQLLDDEDLTGDNIRDLAVREISCAADVCTSALYVLQGRGDGYRVITGDETLINSVTGVQLSDGTADGVPDMIVAGVSADDGEQYSFTLTVQGDALVEVSRIPSGG